MEDVKDTLWKWAIGLIAIFGMGATCVTFIALMTHWWQERDAETQDKGVMLAQLAIFVAPLLTVLWLKLLFRKRWAGWAVAWVIGIQAYFALRQIYEQVYEGRIYDSGERISAIVVSFCTLSMFYALIFKPKLWRGGF